MTTQDDFKWTKGAPKKYQSSKTTVRDFCGTCGCLLTFVVADWNKMGITTVTLDQPESVRPSAHIFCSSQISWLSLKDDLERNPEANW